MADFHGCPGSRSLSFGGDPAKGEGEPANVPSQLRQWPIQLHLIAPTAPYYMGADVLLAADCVPFAMGNFHGDFLKGRALAIACPKLDVDQDVYAAKIRSWADEAKINSLTVLVMQVPCCRGLLGLALQGLKDARRKIPVEYVVVSLQGEVIHRESVAA